MCEGKAGQGKAGRVWITVLLRAIIAWEQIVDTTQDDERTIAEDFRRQLQERFPAYAGDRDKIDVATLIQSNLVKLRSSIAHLGSNSEKDLFDNLPSELVNTPLPNPRDEPLTHTIVRTICAEVEAACLEAGVPLRGGVAHGVSPTFDINAEQHQVPTTGTSVVELSFGFIAFCSHISKAMSRSLLHKVIEGSVQVGYDSTEILKQIRLEPELKMLWLELFGAYAYGDGPLNVEWRIVPYPQSLTRAMLLSAFERFAIAHEYAHHVEEHGRMESVGVGGDPESHGDEIEADMFAIALCRYMERREKQPNVYLVSGAAPVLLLKCLDYVRRTRQIFAGGGPTQRYRQARILKLISAS